MNRAQAWLRVMLWLLPTGFAVGSAFAGAALNWGYLPRLGIGSWIVTNIAFIIGTGWFNAYLSSRARVEGNGLTYRVILFSVIQLFLVPLLLFMILYTICLIDPVKF